MEQENLRIGRQVRDLRKSKGITLATLAQKIGRSVGYVSQVERGVSALPIPTLQAISAALGVQISWFFHTDEETPLNEINYIVRSHGRRSLDFSGTGIREQLLSPALSSQLQMVLTTFAPGAGSQQPRHRRGEEGGLLLSGSLEVCIGDQQFSLNAGDSFSLTGDEPHWVSNSSGTEEAVVMWVLSGGKY